MAATVAPAMNIPQGGGNNGGNSNFYAPGIPRTHRTPSGGGSNNPGGGGGAGGGAGGGGPGGGGVVTPSVSQPPERGGAFTTFSKFNTKLYQKHLQAVEAAKNASADGTFDGKQLRKSVYRKTIDYNSSVVKYLQNRIWMRDNRDRRAIQPDNLYHSEVCGDIFHD